MIKLKQANILNILPCQFKDDIKLNALSYAIQNLTNELLSYADKTCVYSNIECLSNEILDILAIEMQTQYYDETLPLEIKRKLIQNTLNWYVKAGTTSCVEEFAKVFGDEAEVLEWFEYGGRPFYFKLKYNLSNNNTFNNRKTIIDNLHKYKRKSSKFECFLFFYKLTLNNKNFIIINKIISHVKFQLQDYINLTEITNRFIIYSNEHYITTLRLLINVNIKNPIAINKMVNYAKLQLQNYVNYKNIINRFVITNKKFRCFDDEWCFGDNNVFFNDYIDIFKFKCSVSFNSITLNNKNLINLYRIVNHNVFQLQNYIKSKEITNKIVVYTNEHYFNILKILINANIKNPINLNKIINYNVFQLQNYIRFKGITNKIIVYTNEHYINIVKLLVNIHYKSSRIFIDNKININLLKVNNKINIKPTIKFEINTKEGFNNCIRTIEHETKYFDGNWCFGDDDAYFDNYVEREVI